MMPHLGFKTLSWGLIFGTIVSCGKSQKPLPTGQRSEWPHSSLRDTDKALFPWDDQPRGRHGLRVAFYNVENLFDTEDDPGKKDEEFLPSGMRNWTESRYQAKLKAIARVLIAIGGWEAPEIVGLCEVENRRTLADLISRTPLHRFEYDFIHEESPDQRGVDVALLYRPDKFRPFHHRALRLRFPFDTTARTRDILLVSGKILNRDTLHVFVNHWPSKFGGAKETEPRRRYAARVVRQACDSLLRLNSKAKILIMGDLNDEHFEPSIREDLRALPPSEVSQPGDLYNLAALVREGGSHKFQQYWHLIDQMIVSAGLWENAQGFVVKDQRMHIFSAPFLLVPDENNLGFKPNRTFEGMRYNGGFADHLPVFLDLVNTTSP
ncbi:MAG: endonuclease/exonuclease/phosphatase family protein [Flavobacteriales bacterium]|nr:endonuclease/exonuclease/phosphatase family protein [Flavobacteriales bacterium]MDW8409902.1 endonuclease/exonuclease/phosphatase family protein [Flavobacteriales bacterium]